MRTRGLSQVEGLLRNVRQAGHMADKEGLLVHVRTCKDTQPKRVPNSAEFMVSDLLGICIGPYMFVQLRKQQFMEGTYAIAVLYCNKMFLILVFGCSFQNLRHVST